MIRVATLVVCCFPLVIPAIAYLVADDAAPNDKKPFCWGGGRSSRILIIFFKIIYFLFFKIYFNITILKFLKTYKTNNIYNNTAGRIKNSYGTVTS
jgi:hypothetical protein